MTDRELELLREIAAKLGTTVEHLWGVLVAQAATTGVVAAVQLIGVAGLIAGTWWVWRTAHGASAGSYEESYQDQEARQFKLYVHVVAGTVLGLVTLCATAFEAPGMLRTAITAFTNPEYLALQELLRALR